MSDRIYIKMSVANVSHSASRTAHCSRISPILSPCSMACFLGKSKGACSPATVAIVKCATDCGNSYNCLTFNIIRSHIILDTRFSVTSLKTSVCFPTFSGNRELCIVHASTSQEAPTSHYIVIQLFEWCTKTKNIIHVSMCWGSHPLAIHFLQVVVATGTLKDSCHCAVFLSQTR